MINFVEYVKQLWDTTVKFGPTRMNHMEDGIKGNSDAVVGLNEVLDDVDALIGDTSISGIGDGTVTGAISSLNVNLTNISSMVNLFKSSPIKPTGATTSASFTVDTSSVGTKSSGMILGLCDANSQCVVFAIPVHDRAIFVNNMVQIKSSGASGVSATVSGNVLTINTSIVYSHVQLLSPWTIA